ncbi:MAG: VRR-NUC domain-containing protein [Pseudomonas sp.]|uniref:VRR-NUC domain-containing protein n=1 Tax=Pseudomonas abieticivorans TaxID=2931382 RepID=UPI0020C07791|nr:VRR-NUC domain-containing protein [Pseudomonas sp. PIA16]MDE1166146.1 VRR-NUC domain-containing protein [Pseudomonas sp.]
MTVSPLDDPFYYLVNFQRVLDWLSLRYSDVLDAEEQRFIARFAQVPRPAQALLVRLVMRKGPLFRASKLVYDEIGATALAVQPLLDEGWVNAQAPLALAELFEVLQKPEIITTFKPWIRRASARKDELLAQIAEHAPPAQAFGLWCPHLDDQVYALPVRPLCERLRLLFFGNLHQGWTDFVLADLGIFRYETVDMPLASRGLQNRADVELGLQLHHCREALEAGAELMPLLAQLRGLASDNPWLRSRRDKLLFSLAYQCERQGLLLEALAIYSECAYPGSRARQIRVLERLERFEQAHALALLAEQAPESAAEAQHLPRVIPRLRRQLGLPATARSKKPVVLSLHVELAPGEVPMGVEFAVQAHLHEHDGPVYYVENSLLNSLFGLLCWPAIFAALPGAFFHPFQSGPADLMQPDFHTRRADLFGQCLAELSDERYKATIRTRYHSKFGVQSPFVFWGALSEELLAVALDCLPAEHLRRCFERLLEDVKANRSGMPDLIQFWPQEKRYRMIEVKGPGDRLQDNQLRWLDFCAQHQMPVQVCYVQWAASAP